MRVQGNISPAIISIEDYRPLEGYVEIRLRENINTISITNKISGIVTSMFDYDEYIFHLPSREGLQAEIEANLNDWLLTGRTLEVNESASIVAEKNNIIVNQDAYIVDLVYENTQLELGLEE